MRNCAEARQHVANVIKKIQIIPQMNLTTASNVQTVKKTIQHMPKYVKNEKKRLIFYSSNISKISLTKKPEK